jgi:hypothetical protein
MPAPPIYQPEIVADAILYAAEHPVRDLIVGGAGKGFLEMQRISPRLLDAMLARFGFEIQQTDEPKSEDAPTNLWAPIEGYDRAEGDFSDQALRRSAYTWLETRPAIRGALLGVILATLGLRRMRRQHS